MAKRRGKRQTPSRGGFLPVLLAAVLLVAGAVLLNRPKPEPEPTPAPEPETVLYRGNVLPVLEGVPVNKYDHAAFSTGEGGRVDYPNAKQGIDVSVYQKEIDWNAVAGDGVEFAILRLGYRGYTEGGLNPDTYFEENLTAAREAGLEVGVYFFSQAITPAEAEEEAAFVLERLDGRPLDYPVVFDWEFIGPGKDARTDKVDKATLTQCVRAFCDRIALGGYDPMAYFNQDLAYLFLDLSALADIPFWLAEYDDAPDFYYGFDLWQYTHTGTVAGIEGAVDRSLDLRNAI